MADTIDIDDLSASILTAAESGVPIAPLTQTYPDLTLTDAYRLQTAQRDAHERSGARVVGHKIGLTSPAIQQQLGVDQPDYGFITDAMVCRSGEPVDLSRFIAPRVEPELIFTLGRSLTGPGLTVADIVDAVAWCSPGLEIIDSRIRDWQITLADTVADNASSGAAVLSPDGADPAGVDLGAVGCILRNNGTIVATGSSAAVLGHPLNAVTWLANTLGAEGTELAAGTFVLSGSITAAVPISPGDVITADFGGLGGVTLICRNDDTED